MMTATEVPAPRYPAPGNAGEAAIPAAPSTSMTTIASEYRTVALIAMKVTRFTVLAQCATSSGG